MEKRASIDDMNYGETKQYGRFSITKETSSPLPIPDLSNLFSLLDSQRHNLLIIIDNEMNLLLQHMDANTCSYLTFSSECEPYLNLFNDLDKLKTKIIKFIISKYNDDEAWFQQLPPIISYTYIKHSFKHDDYFTISFNELKQFLNHNL